MFEGEAVDGGGEERDRGFGVLPAADADDDERARAVEAFGGEVERFGVGLEEEDGVGGAFDADFR